MTVSTLDDRRLDHKSFVKTSVPVDPQAYASGDYFCLFTPRIHRNADLADTGSMQCQVDFLGSSKAARSAVLRNREKGHDSYAIGSINPTVGNWTALCMCEADPERLALMSYMIEYAYIHDDGTLANSIQFQP
jgi:hypothetical protein